MLINFCNANQMLAAINIEGSTITAYYTLRTVEYDKYAFNRFIIDYLSVTKKTPLTTDDNHYQDYHKEASHLTRLQHCHFDFGTPINQETLNNFIDAIKYYQDKNNPVTRNSYKAGAINYLKNRTTTFNEITDYVVDNVFGYKVEKTPDMKLLSIKNVKRLQDQIKYYQTSSSHQIINLLNISQTRRTLSATIPSSQALQDATCPELNTMAIASGNRIEASATFVEAALGLSLGTIAVLIISYLIRIGYGAAVIQDANHNQPERNDNSARKRLR